MLSTKIFVLAFSLLAIPLSGCVHNIPQLRLESTSKEAFKRAEPYLLSLKVGNPFNSLASNRSFYKISKRGEQENIICVADGWIERLSGGYRGGLYNFGRPYARSDNTVYGAHVYGYLWGNATLIPRYQVITQAKIVTDLNFEQLKNKEKEIDIGWLPGSGNEAIPFKNLIVKEVRLLDFTEPDLSGTHIESLATSDMSDKAYLKFLFNVKSKTPEIFQKTEEKLKQIRKGSEEWEVIKLLNGRYVTPNFGKNYILIMDSFLNYKGDYKLYKMTSKGIFNVWPFGYMEGETETPKLVLIFKNGRVLKLVPYTSKAELEKYFSK